MPVLQSINAATVLDKTITSEMVGGVLNEVVAVIPTIIPVAIIITEPLRIPVISTKNTLNPMIPPIRTRI